MSAVKTSATEITVQNEKGDASYVVRAATSSINMTNDGPDYGKLSGVTGEVKKDGETTSHFSAQSGLVDRSKQTLLLTGTVKITGRLDRDKGEKSEKSEMIDLTADTVRYDQNLKRYEATGRVTVVSKSMSLGPVPKIYANSDLTRFGTPGKFK